MPALPLRAALLRLAAETSRACRVPGAEAEATAGEEPHGTIQLLGPELGSGRHRCDVQRLLPLGALQGDAQPQQVVASLGRSNALFVFDWQGPAPQLHSLLAGHVGNVTAVATCAALPTTLASGSCEWPARAGMV